MFIPIGDTPNPRFTPWMNWALIAINVVVFLALWPQAYRRPDLNDPVLRNYVQTLLHDGRVQPQQVRQVVAGLSEYDLIVYAHGFRPSAPSLPTVLSSMFLHGGLLHLLGNMLFLWIFGDNIEHRVGRLAYLLVYLATGTAAAGSDALIRWGSSIPSVGASGAISGILGAYFLWFPHNRVRVFIFLFPFFANVIELPARLVLGFFIVVENLLPLLLSDGAGGGVSYGAHIGGFVTGLAGAWLLGHRVFARPEPELRRARSGSRPPPGSVGETFRAALDGDRLAEAAGLLFDSPRSATVGQLAPPDLLRLAHGLDGAGHKHAALATCQKLINDYPPGRATVSAHLLAAEILDHSFRQPTAAFQHLRAALALATDPDDIAHARALAARLMSTSDSFPRGIER